MLTKIKILFFTSILVLSCQTTIFSMKQPKKLPIQHLQEMFANIDNTKINTVQGTENIIIAMLEHLNTIDSNNEKIEKEDLEFFLKRFNALLPLYKNEIDKERYQQDITFKFFSQYQSSEFFQNQGNKIPMRSLSEQVNKLFTEHIIVDFSQPISVPKQTIVNSKTTIHLDLDNIKQQLVQLIETSGSSISFETNMPDMLKLWNKFLTLHNYNWLDRILYQNQPDIDSPEEAKYIRKLQSLLHPDKQGTLNDQQAISLLETEMFEYIKLNTEMFKYINNKTRPEKPLDFIVNNDAIKILKFQAQSHLFVAAFSLPSVLFPNYFKNKQIAQYQEATKDVILDIKEYGNAIKEHDNAIKKYDNAIKQHDNAIKKHDNAIKRKDLSISIKQQQVRDAYDILFTKKNFSN